MSLTLINEYSNVSNADIDSIELTLDKTRIGLHSVSLTNFLTTTIPAISAGSVVEVDGALYSAEAEESITGSPSDGNVYVKIVPAGATATAEFTNTAPEWDAIKQGWYSPTGGEENYRYLEFKIVKATASYIKQHFFGSGGTTVFPSNVVFEGSASFAGNSIAGFLDDGTKFYKKLIRSAGYTNGQSAFVITHGISNAFTGNKILNVSYNAIVNGQSYYKVIFDTGVLVNNLKSIFWTDTTLYIEIYQAFGSSGTFTDINVVIDYI